MRQAAWIVLLIGIIATGCSTSTPVHQNLASSHRLLIGLTEWAVTVGPHPLTAGTDTLVITNAGSTIHDLKIQGPGVKAMTPMLQPGQQARLRIETQAGEQLRLWCTVTGHDTAGMHIVITVASDPRAQAAAPLPSGTTTSDSRT